MTTEEKLPEGWRKAKGQIINAAYVAEIQNAEETDNDVFYEDSDENTIPLVEDAEVYMNDEQDVWFKTKEEMDEWVEDNSDTEEEDEEDNDNEEETDEDDDNKL